MVVVVLEHSEQVADLAVGTIYRHGCGHIEISIWPHWSLLRERKVPKGLEIKVAVDWRPRWTSRQHEPPSSYETKR